MTMLHFRLTIIYILAFSAFAYSQQQPKASSTNKSTSTEATFPAKSSPAYAEILLKKTELQADLESLILEYTEEYPKVLEIRFTLGLIQKESKKMIAMKPAETLKLTLALGKLMVRKVELETDMWGLQRNYKDDHPDVKRAKRKVEIYESAIREILG